MRKIYIVLMLLLMGSWCCETICAMPRSIRSKRSFDGCSACTGDVEVVGDCMEHVKEHVDYKKIFYETLHSPQACFNVCTSIRQYRDYLFAQAVKCRTLYAELCACYETHYTYPQDSVNEDLGRFADKIRHADSLFGYVQSYTPMQANDNKSIDPFIDEFMEWYYGFTLTDESAREINNEIIVWCIQTHSIITECWDKQQADYLQQTCSALTARVIKNEITTEDVGLIDMIVAKYKDMILLPYKE